MTKNLGKCTKYRVQLLKMTLIQSLRVFFSNLATKNVLEKSLKTKKKESEACKQLSYSTYPLVH